MNMIKVKSSNIESIGYDARRFHLFVEFKATDRSPAKTFVYYDVNLEEYESMMAAKSVGKVFHSTIKAVKDGCLYELEKPKLTKDEIITGKNTQIEILKLHVEMLRAEVAVFASILKDDPESAAPLHELLERTAPPTT
ncbi:hypothetical protein MAELSTROM_20 [Pseudoalteromonas phage Maelstrom]|uniref:hypothetical protein n=1 Tax=Pseudoalteromonas phage Maelstrom TaxID=2065202 RepID=UPI000CA1E7EE|nr:hypothetical protein PP584_gp20 [Pseudoalteromonas phage Maelstrom]AUG84940.1 hypothetical protein MAELSTROM_20 [Pseudoalteromonas phage Maelstrom]